VIAKQSTASVEQRQLHTMYLGHPSLVTLVVAVLVQILGP
jgi:hypothetical protein